MKESVLSVKNLTIQYKDAEEPVIKDLSFELQQGEILCISGKSGAGKSTIVWALLEMLEDYNAVAFGEIGFEGDVLHYQGTDLKKRKWNWRQIALVPQASMSGFNPLFTIGETMMEMLDVYEGKGRKAEKKQRIIELLDMVCLKNKVFDSYPHELSGGMKQRAAIAMAIMFHPKVLVLDEATTGLDLLIQAEVLGTILELKKKEDISILFISHDRELASNFCDRQISIQ
ncbi:MAG: ABC transporter ATP-binding protein [Lachnospiraceae bacterium]|nr:ABC transporter ATP-binding protein [Lachnospiraceae bacterium]